LSNKNKSATVSKFKKFLDLNKAYVSIHVGHTLSYPTKEHEADRSAHGSRVMIKKNTFPVATWDNSLFFFFEQIATNIIFFVTNCNQHLLMFASQNRGSIDPILGVLTKFD